jgi:membrane protein YdbS with pleckstrin-like domain
MSDIIHTIGTIYVAGLFVSLIIVVMASALWRDVESPWFMFTAVIFWPVPMMFLLGSVPFIFLDMVKTCKYKFIKWRIEVEHHNEHD